MRKSGILLAVSSLPNKYGIGCFSKEAYDFVDYLVSAGQSIWQILPLGPTGYGDSPYQSFSTFAGNPYFIDLEELIKDGLLTVKECEKTIPSGDGRYADYEHIYKTRFKLLKTAYKRFCEAFSAPDTSAGKRNSGSVKKMSVATDYDSYPDFCKSNSDWLDDYALYMSIKDSLGGKSFFEWSDALRFRRKAALDKARRELSAEIGFYKFIQFLFFYQWKKLKKYANDKGVSILGDIPIYVALDSADTWSHPELFQFDSKGFPLGVAGCPPDYFSATGQLWGNPLYDWEYHAKTGFDWWMKRLAHCFEIYDSVRIDHFRGFDEYYFVPWQDKTAEFGHWVKGPGYALFEKMHEKMGKKPVVAEDLGFLTKTVKRLVKRTGYPGMKILEFAFDSDTKCEYLPHNYTSNCVVYTGTHDNDTVLGWYKSLTPKRRKFVRDYLGIKSARELNWDMIRLAERSVADTVVIPLQDVLGLGSEGRMNTPSTLGFNWQWRLLPGELTKESSDKLKNICETYDRA